MEQKKKDALAALLGTELTEEILKKADEVNEGALEESAVFKEIEEKAKKPFADRLDELADATAKENPIAANRIKAIAKALRASYGKEYPEPEKKEGETEDKARKKRPIEELREIADQLKGDLQKRLQTLIGELEKSYGKKAKPEDEEYEEPKKKKEVCEECGQDPCVCEKPKEKKDAAVELLEQIGDRLTRLETEIKEFKSASSTRASLTRPTGEVVIGEAKTETKSTPDVPRAVQAITNKVLGLS